MMKRFLICCFTLIMCQQFYAQKNCDYDVQVKDSLGDFRSTKEYLAYERKFGESESYLFLSLSNNNGIPYLTVQHLQKNNQFIKANCLDANSKLYLQLENGKIITLIHENVETCGNFLINPDDNRYTRVVSGNFLFLKNAVEELKKSPVTMLRIRFGAENTDFIIKKELDSELTKKFYRPEAFFIDYLHCVLD